MTLIEENPLIARRILQGWYGLRSTWINYVKPLSWWMRIEQPHSRMTTPNTIEIRGWTFNPLAEVVSIEVFIEGKRFGKLSYGEARADVYRRFRMPNSRFCGFSGRIRYETTLNRELVLILRITDDVNEQVDFPVEVTVSAPVLEAEKSPSDDLPTPQVVEELQKVLNAYRLRFIDEPVIADWDTGLQLKTVFPQLDVLKPLDATFPYVEGGMDIVMVGSQHIRNLENARFAAKNLLIGVIGGQVGGRTEFKAQWLKPPEYTETASVIITADDRTDLNMLKDLLSTLSIDLITEIIIIHDVKLDLQSLIRTDTRLKEVFTSPEVSLVITRNRAALSALGDVIIFMNASELPQPNWLAPIMRLFARYPDCGAIFGKILATDGRLYEAGGMVFSNGQFYSYGQTDVDVNAARYTYVREVDTGSTGLFATRRALFVSLQGFNTEYIADGYEVVDYCFRVREDDRRVMYQPESHIRQLFSPRRNEDGRKRFTGEWKDRLSEHPRAPAKFEVFDLYKLTLRDVSKKQVVFCIMTLPPCTLTVEYRRLWHLIQLLHHHSYDVRLLVVEIVEQKSQKRAFEELGIPVYPLKGEQSPLNLSDFYTAHRFDCAICFGWKAGEYFIPSLREHSPKTRVILEAGSVNFIHAQPQAQAQQKSPLLLTEEYGQMLVAEINTYRQTDQVVLSRESDYYLLNELNPLQRNLNYVPTVDDLPVSKLAFGQRNGILVIGDFRHFSDRNALEFFVKKILPKMDSLTLVENPVRVIGCGLETLDAPKSPHVHYVGWVSSVLPYIEHARVVVIPSLEPHTMNLSIIQAMLVGTPVVCTAYAAQEFDLRHDENVLIADDADSFADHIFHLLSDDTLWIRIAAFGYEYMLNTRHVSLWDEMYIQILEGLTPTGSLTRS